MDRKKFIRSAAALALFPKVLPGAEEVPVNHNIEHVDGEVDWNKIRRHFMIDSRLTYLNNGTMGICPEFINKEIYKQFQKVSNRVAYPGDITGLREALSRVTGTGFKNLTITKNVTEGINIACWGVELNAGDEVLMTRHEHAGGAIPWIYRAKTENIVIKTFELAPTASETLENLKKAVTPNTKVIAVPHIPCTIGQILPVKEICAYAREKNIISIIDGAHPLGMIRLNIDDIGCDYYAGCLHKWLLAPLGMGFFYVRPERLKSTRIYNLGAYSTPDFNMSRQPPFIAELADEVQRFSPGTFCGPMHVAAIKSIEWYEKIGIDNVEKRVKALGKYLQQELLKLHEDIILLTPVEDISRGAQTTFKFKNLDAKKYSDFLRLDPNNIIVRYVHEADLDAIRVSTHYYNNEKEINKLITATKKFIGK